MSKPPIQDLEVLLETLVELRRDLDSAAAERLAPYRDRLASTYALASACNLAQYLALRHFDLRPLQRALASNGLSSLGRSEAHVLGTLDQIIDLVSRALQRPVDAARTGCAGVGFEEGLERLEENTARVLGTTPRARRVRIMVTLPERAGSDAAYVERLLAAGMDCARINCAHDTPEARRHMIDHVRRAAASQGRECRVLVDLAGPKHRTGPLENYIRPVHIKPHRDVRGMIRRAATILLEPAGSTRTAVEPDTEIHFEIPAQIADGLRTGDRLRLTDTRGKSRALVIERALGDGRWLASCRQSTYLDADTELRVERRQRAWHEEPATFTFSGFKPEMVDLRLFIDDTLVLRADNRPGHPARRDTGGKLVSPATIGCLGVSDFAPLRPGEPVWFDDGKLGAEVVEANDREARLRITHARTRGSRLKPDRGINFPGTPMDAGPLTPRDLDDLDWLVDCADAVGYSFVEDAGDMEYLMDELARRGAQGLPIIAKIETRRAVENLPAIIFSTIGQHPLGVMIARGDLAVEVGVERLAELQEEILWVCEAAHVPVVWATQVLETLVKKGSASRPELTDAAMSNRAECVMLNKGPYIERALLSLADILVRMQDHQTKKTALLRPLHW